MIITQKLQTEGPFSGGGSGFCDAASLVVALNINCSFVITDLNYVCTKTSTSDAFGALDCSNINITLGSEITVGEITINSVSNTSEEIRPGLGFGDPFGIFAGFTLKPGTGAADGQYYDQDGTPVGGAVSITLPHTIQLIVNGNTNQVSFDDGTNSGVLGTYAGLSAQANSSFYPLATNEGSNGSSMDVDVNVGSSAFSITPPAGFKRWCEI